MLKGIIAAVLSKFEERAKGVADKIGKLEDKNGIEIYYRKLDQDLLLSVLVPTDYPESIIDLVRAASLSDVLIYYAEEPFNSFDGELILLMKTLGKRTMIIGGGDRARKLLSDAGFSNALFLERPEDISFEGNDANSDDGYAYIDRVFPVKGVGTVMLGFAKTNVKAHDRFISLPTKEEIEIKSIQVLDVDYKEVDYGTRVGLAIKGGDYNKLKDSYALTNGKFVEEIEGEIEVLPWSSGLKNGFEYHVHGGGCYSPGTIEVEGKKAKVKLKRPLPVRAEYLIVSPSDNAKRSRIVGRLISSASRI
jgi:selenocysteine-specific translation elongation factor